MKIRVLGSGTSSGVPIPGCRCAVCTSPNPKNQRLRTSIAIDIPRHVIPDHGAAGAASAHPVQRILVDTAPDLRIQALRAELTHVDAVLYTHTHADHIFGIDDLRSFNFINHTEIPVYGSSATCAILSSTFRYAFFADPTYEGGAPPRLTINQLTAYEPIALCGVSVLPLPVLHGRMEVFGYRIGNFAYLTDCNQIPERTREHLVGLDTLILDGLRHRHHATHFTIREAIDQVERLQPKRAYLTHLSHEVEHDEGNEAIRGMTSRAVELAYDGLTLELENPPMTEEHP